MITMLHLADLHIGMENYGRVDPTTGLHSRLLDYLKALDEAIEIGLAAQVDLVLIAGDVYKNRTPNPTHQREFARRIRRLREAGVPVVILIGNHDTSPTVGRAHAIEIFDTLAVEGVTVADRPKLHRIATRSGPVQIIALPWLTRHVLMTREDVQRASFLEIETMLLSRVDQFLRDTAAALDPAVPTVLTIHGTIEGATTGVERQIMLGKDLALPRSFTELPGVDYVAMGHIHKHQVLGTHPPIVYPGSIERIDFGEEHEDKGCVLVSLEKGATTWSFRRLHTRPFTTIKVDVRQSENPQALATAAVERAQVGEAVVQVKIEARPEQTAQLRPDDLRGLLEERGAFHIAAVALEVERATRSRLGEQAHELLEGLTPRRALELYLRAKSTPEGRIAELLAAADELLAEGAEL